jgi:hypothetical protein
MTPLTPKRIPEVSDLVSSVASCLVNMKELKQNPTEINSGLAICELLTGMPPKWFTEAEKFLILAVIKELHGDPESFLNAIMSGELSYVSKCEKLTRGRSADELNSLVMAAHLASFGEV